MRDYFKKLSAMFVMSLILVLGSCVSAFAADDGVVGTANLSNTPENSAKVGDKLTAPEVGWKRYENTNKNITYVGSGWILYNDSYTSKGNVNYTETASGASVKFNFTGNKIRIINLSNLAHNKQVDVYIDGVKVDTHSIYSEVRAPQKLVYENNSLSTGEHYFEYKYSGTGQGVFDAVDIDGNGILKPYNKIESITLDKSTINLTEGDSDKLTAITSPSAVGVTWTSSDPSIATIEVNPTNGKITKVNAIKEGTCTITATTVDGSNLSASCTINVTKKDVPKPDNPTPDTKTGAILIINLTDGETKVFDVSSSEVDKFKYWYNNKSEFENKLTYVFNKTVNSNISVEEDVVHNQITSFEIRKY
jgi:uncharacterized protein YjdB